MARPRPSPADPNKRTNGQRKNSRQTHKFPHLDNTLLYNRDLDRAQLRKAQRAGNRAVKNILERVSGNKVLPCKPDNTPITRFSPVFSTFGTTFTELTSNQTKMADKNQEIESDGNLVQQRKTIKHPTILWRKETNIGRLSRLQRTRDWI
jgi:hypothetical protein